LCAGCVLRWAARAHDPCLQPLPGSLFSSSTSRGCVRRPPLAHCRYRKNPGTASLLQQQEGVEGSIPSRSLTLNNLKPHPRGRRSYIFLRHRPTHASRRAGRGCEDEDAGRACRRDRAEAGRDGCPPRARRSAPCPAPVTRRRRTRASGRRSRPLSSSSSSWGSRGRAALVPSAGEGEVWVMVNRCCGCLVKLVIVQS